MSKKCLLVVLAILFSVTILFGAAAEPVVTLKMGHTGAPNHHYQHIAEQYAAEVLEATKGAVKIEVFPSDQLGNQMEATEGVMFGTHDMVLTSDMVLSNWVPEFGILNLPFLFKNNEHMRKVLDGEIGQKFASLVEPTGATLIGWWDNGFRHVTNSKVEIKTPADLVGLKIRVPEGEIYLDTFQALGALPTVISFGELYSALQLKTVDGQENPPAHIITQKFYEVQKYVSRTNHIHSCSPLLINTGKLMAIPEEYRQTFIDVTMKYGAIHTNYVAELEVGQWKEVADHGMVVTDVDPEPFVKAVQPVYEKAKAKFGAELIDAIIKASGN